LILVLSFMTGDIWPAESAQQCQNAIMDHAIALAVENKIRADGVVPMDPIDISVHNGRHL
jgi:hypothetical protein